MAKKIFTALLLTGSLMVAACNTVEGAGRDVQWRIDGKPFARGPSAQWLPWPGRHTVELADAAAVHALVDDLAGLSAAQWQAPSLADGWTVHDVAAHLVNLAWNGLSGMERAPGLMEPPAP